MSKGVPYLCPLDFEEMSDTELSHRSERYTQTAVACDLVNAWLLACSLVAETSDPFVFENEEILGRLTLEHGLGRETAKQVLSAAARVVVRSVDPIP